MSFSLRHKQSIAGIIAVVVAAAVFVLCAGAPMMAEATSCSATGVTAGCATPSGPSIAHVSLDTAYAINATVADPYLVAVQALRTGPREQSEDLLSPASFTPLRA